MALGVLPFAFVLHLQYYKHNTKSVKGLSKIFLNPLLIRVWGCSVAGLQGEGKAYYKNRDNKKPDWFNQSGCLGFRMERDRALERKSDKII